MMRWFKHDSAANADAKLKKLRIKYGMEGYGLYWYCLELIASEVSSENLTFELEHDSEIIAHDTGIHFERVQEMMTYMVNLGLFEEKQGVITCLKMARRLDQSMTSNPHMRKLIDGIKNNHDGIRNNHDGAMTKSRKVMQDKIRLDKKYKYSDEHYAFAEDMLEKIRNRIPKFKTPNLKAWAQDIRLLNEKDENPMSEIKEIFERANADDFWGVNIQSPGKLRAQYATLHAKFKKPATKVATIFDLDAVAR